MDVKKNTELLIRNIERVKLDKVKLEKQLINNYTDELLNKIVEINRIIKDAEFLITCSTDDGNNMFKKKFPSKIDKNGEFTDKGIKHLNLLNKKLDLFK